MMIDGIKLLRLKEIIQSEYGIDSNINLTTMLLDEDRALLNTITDEILVNGNQCKGTDDIIEAVAHEVAHLVKPSLKDGSEKFNRLWTEIFKNMGSIYYARERRK